MRSIPVRSCVTALCLAAVAACGPSGPSNGPQRAGSVNVTALSGMLAGMTFASTTVNAGFVEAPASAAQPCTTRTVGACTINECTTSSSDAGAPDPDAGAPAPDAGMVNTARSAGVITVSGGGQMVQLTPGADGTYTSNMQRMTVFPAGTELTMSAVGDAMGVPAFTGTVTMPAAVMVTAPALSFTTATMISRSQALNATWTGGTAGKVSVLLAGNSGGRNVVVNCAFDATAGSGTVPVDVLAALPAGSGTIVIGGSSTRDVMAGGYKVSLAASSANIIGGAGAAMFE